MRDLLDRGVAAGGAPRMWRRIILASVPTIRHLLPPGSNVLEVGHGDGLLTCWLAAELGWSITGLDIREQAYRDAMYHAEMFGLSSRLTFKLVKPDETWQHQGSYDGVFIKTVLYASKDLDEYGRRLDWVATVLKPGGIFVNFETGRANALTQAYRRIRRREYADLCLYTSAVEHLYDVRFEILDREYYGGYSQFVAPFSALYELADLVERRLAPRRAENCFVVAIIARSRREIGASSRKGVA